MGLYKNNKKAKTHSTIECPICHKKFKKVQYSQAFCSGRCKDRFWNSKGDRHIVSPSKESIDHILDYDGAENDQWGDCDFGIHD
jgi:endogenous inhibitor of DNA gyrase (YacG/DUF329 family)